MATLEEKPWLWMNDQDIKCKGQTRFFYPTHPSTDVSKAKAVCNGLDGLPPCPHREECLRFAIDNHEPFGVWGGTSERDRRKIQRARNRFKNPFIYSLEDVRFHNVIRVEIIKKGIRVR